MFFNRKKKFRLTISYLSFFLYICVLLYLLFFSNYRNMVQGVIDYNFIPFKSITNYLIDFERFNIMMLTDNFFGNLAAFIPFGYFMPFFFERCKKLVWTLAISSLFSLLIETSQLLFRLGAFDIDDIILNTIGGLIGYVIWRILKPSLK